ncbi:cell wall hydrolase [Novosphingobium gossypii]|uniref:cell wall hydrolase n=1 Tax=Novosphingobium gossypii TaxID=1604774 RepID=UPI003D19DD82
MIMSVNPSITSFIGLNLKLAGRAAPVCHSALRALTWLALIPLAQMLISGSPHVTGKVAMPSNVQTLDRATGNAASTLAPTQSAALFLAEVPADKARQINQAVPFTLAGIERPLPFHMAADTAGYDRALDCLASAALYEAGDNRVAQSAVAQVVLNRVRHPAFPHSICAVVYQGSERASGCQFTFTCDGALRRVPSPAAWYRARQTASGFLAGQIDLSVGMATHYHTDWVHPYWSSSLDKIAQVGTHLFFRWPGTWGRRKSFDVAYNEGEPIQPQLAGLSSAHRVLVPAAPKPPSSSAPVPVAPHSQVLAVREGDHLILVDGGGDGDRLALDGLGTCQGQVYCKIVGWDRRSAGYGSPLNPTLQTVAFLYVSDKRTGVEIVLWDCARFNRPSEAQCLSEKNRRWISFQGNFSSAS